MHKVKQRTDDRTSIIKRVPFFAGLSDAELQSISKRFTERRFKKGEYIFMEGEPGTHVYAIREGRVKVLRESPSGRSIVMEVLSSGEICGASALLGGTRFASAKAVENTSVYALSKDDFLYLLDKHRDLAPAVIAFLGEKLVKLHEMMMSLVSGKVEQRIAALLLGLSERHGASVSQGIKINICLTRQDIADIIGTTVETTIRVMSKFKKLGIVASDSKQIVITDIRQLRKLSRGSSPSNIRGPAD